jgi:hypothetical protein
MYVVLGDADQKVYTVANHEQYIQYWQEKKLALEAQKSRLPGESIDSITAEIKRSAEILLLIGEFLKDIRDTNNPHPKDDDEAIAAIKTFITAIPVPKDTHSGGQPQATPGVLKKTLLAAGF